MSTKIAWTNETWNPTTGCTSVSEGCRHCYAARLAAGRLKHHPDYKGLSEMRNGRGVFTGDIRLHPDRLDKPLKWRKPRMVFVDSMSDLFHEDIPDEFIGRVFRVMAHAPQHIYQILTKRPKRMRRFMLEMTGPAGLDIGLVWPLRSVWLGVSAEDQETADERIPLLIQTPAALRFISAEPLLSRVSLTNLWKPDWHTAPMVKWVIIGGESGPNARPFPLSDAEHLIEDCREEGIAVFLKQLGARPCFDSAMTEVPGSGANIRDPKGTDMSEWPPYLRIREWPKEARNDQANSL